MPDYWKNRPVYKYTSLSRKEFLEIMKDSKKTKNLIKYFNLIKQL